MRIRYRGIGIKLNLLVLTAIIILTLFAGCGSSDSKAPVAANDNAEAGNTAAAIDTSAAPETGGISAAYTQAATTADTAVTGSAGNHGSTDEQLLQSASVDLDGDGVSEQIEAVQVTAKDGSDYAGEIEGRLKIKSGTKESQLTFWKKNAGETGVLTSIHFEDLDGDGAKDIFIIIPDNGAAFSFSKYFIYSYKKNISYSFMSDNELADFISGFSFKKSVANILNLVNNSYGFSAGLTIEYDELDQQSADDYMGEYEQRAWIEPVSVDIGEDSRLALHRADDGTREIKVPLPVFGLATVDMIGEIDLFYVVDSSFKPVLRRFEVLDFNGGDKKRVAGYQLK